MNPSNEREFNSLRDIIRVLFRHKWKGSITFVSLMVLILLALSIWPRQFESEAKLFVRLGRESVALDPTATTGQTVGVQESRENEIRSIQDVLESRVIAERVVDALGHDLILQKEPATEGASSTTSRPQSARNTVEFVRRMLGAPDISPHENAVTTLQKHTQVYSGDKSNVITVRYLGNYAEQAQIVASALIDEYLHEHIQINRNPGSYDFFNRQTALLEQEVENTARALRDTKNEINVTSLLTKKDLLQRRVVDLEKTILDTESRLSVSRAGITALQTHINNLPERLETEVVSGLPNQAGDDMRTRLYSLEIKHQELKSKFTSEYPPLQAIEQQLEEARKTFASQPLEKVQSKSENNLVRRELELNLLTEQATIAPIEAERKTLQQHHVAALAELDKLNDDEIRITRLEREYELASTNLAAYSEKLEQARIDQALEEQRISNVNILQPATFVANPTNPRIRLVLVLGMVIATVGALGVVILSEYFDRSLKSPEDTEQKLELPVLLTIPRMSGQQLNFN